MSVEKRERRKTAPDLAAMKGVRPIVALTAYTTPVARIADRHADVVLVGDSVGMVVYGLPSTLGVTLEMMIAHGQAVMRGTHKALVVIDMPFGSYEGGPAQAFASASRIMAEAGVGAVKLEGGAHMAETIRFLVDRGIPVMGHVGLTPQAVNALGGYRVVGRGAEGERIRRDAEAVSKAGAFAVVLEKTPDDLSREISAALPIPTIGIGASVHCDGQILVSDDMLGAFEDFRPKFVKRYAEFAQEADSAFRRYAEEVRGGVFPGPEHSYKGEA